MLEAYFHNIVSFICVLDFNAIRHFSSDSVILEK